MESYNQAAWQYSRPPHHAASLDVITTPVPARRPRHTSMTGSSPPQLTPHVPSILTPGHHRARIWDKSAAQRPRTSHGSTTSPYQRLYGDYLFAQPQAPPPPLPQKPQALLNPLSSPLPPIPPKPPALSISSASRIPLYPTSIPLSVVTPSSHIPESEPHNDKKVGLALALSASEARKREQELIAQEEEELARALEESRLLSSPVYAIDDQPCSSDRPSISTSAHPPDGKSWLQLTPTASTSSQYSSQNDDPSSSRSSATQNGSDDDPTEERPSDIQDIYASRETLSPALPLYANVVSNLVRNPISPPPPLSPSSSPSLQNDYPPSSDRPSTSPSLSLAHPCSSEQSSMPLFVPRPSWASVSSENGISTNDRLPASSSGYKSPALSSASPDPSPSPSANVDAFDGAVEEGLDTERGQPMRPGPVVPLSANQYVEREMLLGVSLGFALPVISTELLPLAGEMPNAPSWRKLLKLMARLSATRVEPTIDAINATKHDLKLRTVIQFVKIHRSASEWRTVLYLTIDYPIPFNMPNSHKYTNSDVTVLPYSYTLSPLPTLLRDGPESPVAKYYVVPSTPTTPYPTLPIKFPNLAMYLQSAVQDSRRAANDSSSGLRKLAQYIDGCYQTEADRVAPIDKGVGSKKGVGGMFKRVIGRHKASKTSRGNEEIYDLVTPFVSNEYG